MEDRGDRAFRFVMEEILVVDSVVGNKKAAAKGSECDTSECLANRTMSLRQRMEISRR